MGRESYQSNRVVETPAPSGMYSQSGNSGPMRGYGAFKTIMAQLEVTSAPAPSGTLDVSIEHSLDGVNWWQLPFNNGTPFDQVTGLGVQVAFRDDGMFFDTLRVRWDISAGSQFGFNIQWQLDK